MAKVLHIDSRGRMYRTLSREEQYQNDREHVLTTRMHAEGNKTELFAYMYGATNLTTDDGKLLVAGQKASRQKRAMRYNTKGDFCHLHSGRNEIR